MVHNPLTSGKNRWVFLGTLATLIVIQAYSLHLFLGFTWWAVLWNATVNWSLLGLLVFLITNTFSYFHPSRGKWAVMLVVPLVLSLLFVKLSSWFSLAGIEDISFSSFFKNHLFYHWTVSYLIFTATVTLSLLWYRIGEREDEQKRLQEAHKLAKEAELFKLRQQLQPHFLFNSLNSINSLIGSRPAEARNMIQQLSDFFRGTLKREQQAFVLLDEEINYLNIYLQIEQVRFGHRMQVQMEIPEELLSWKLPPLLLQPLLENAIKFGLYGTTDAVVVKLSAIEENNLLQLKISNPYDVDMQPAKGTGFGLSSVKRRLTLLYARHDLLEIKDENQQFEVRLKIPRSYD